MKISVTSAAAEHLREDLAGRLLRIAYTTGCGGSGYRLASANQPEADDTVVQVDGLRLALDNMAASRLEGAVIDYRDQEEGYVIDHPDAVSAVWCG